MVKVTTFILQRDGRMLHSLPNCSQEDAARWAAEGYTVFRVCVHFNLWAVVHVNSGRTMSSADKAHFDNTDSPVLKLLEDKGE